MTEAHLSSEIVVDMLAVQCDIAQKALITNKSLWRLGLSKGLDSCVLLDPGATTVSKRTMATTMEALTGAVYLDGGDDALNKVFERLGFEHEYLHAVTSTPLPSSRRAGVVHTKIVNWSQWALTRGLSRSIAKEPTGAVAMALLGWSRKMLQMSPRRIAMTRISLLATAAINYWISRGRPRKP